MTEFQKKTRAQLLDMPMETPYTVGEVAIVLNVHTRSVERAINSGAMKSARVLGGRRIKKSWVFEYLHAEMDRETQPDAKDFSRS